MYLMVSFFIILLVVLFFTTDLTFGRVCSRSEKLMQASLFSRLIAAFTDFSDFRFELKKTSKTPLVMAEVYRPDVLSFRPVLKSELLHSPQVHHGFCQNSALTAAKNIKKLCSRPYWIHAFCFLMFLPDEEVISQK